MLSLPRFTLALVPVMTLVCIGQLAAAQNAASQEAVRDNDKPSPVPSRMRKQERARALNSSQAGSNQMAPTWTGSAAGSSVSSTAEAVHWDGPQTGTSVFFSKNVLGKTSASGQVLDPDDMIAAHASLPFGTLVKVTNMKNGKEVTVRIVDRISASSTHIISVSERAAAELDFRRTGIGSVRIMPVASP